METLTPYTKKDSPYGKKTNPYQKHTTTPYITGYTLNVMLMEDWDFLLLEMGFKISL